MYNSIIEPHPKLGYIGWNSHDPDKILSDSDPERLDERLQCVYLPSHLNFTHSNHWSCWDWETSLKGVGSSPQEAFHDLDHQIKNTWHRTRVNRLFALIRRYAEIQLTLDADKATAHHNANEIELFIRSWYENH